MGEAAFGQWSFGAFAKAEIHEGNDARPGRWRWGVLSSQSWSWRRGQFSHTGEGGKRSQDADAMCTQGSWMLSPRAPSLCLVLVPRHGSGAMQTLAPKGL